jgi:hypothetical protein
MIVDRLIVAKSTFIPQLKVTSLKRQLLSFPQPNVPQLSVFSIGEKLKFYQFFRKNTTFFVKIFIFSVKIGIS